jgi:phosphoserine phosphatase RsbU/P
MEKSKGTTSYRRIKVGGKVSLKRFRKLIDTLDHRIVELVVEVPRKYYALIIVIITLMMIGSALVLRYSGGDLQVDLFFLPLVLAFIFFKMRGLLFMIPGVILYHLGGWNIGVRGMELLGKDLMELAKWGFLSFMVIYAVNKFGDLKRFEERMKMDVGLAKALQKTLLSKPFDLENVRVLGYIHQCMEVGGDFYYFRPFKKKHIVLAIGDIMGKGIPASFVMGVVMSFFYEWGKKSFSPSFILDKINKRIIDLWGEGAWYSTLFYSIYDEESRELTYANGGHQKGILIRAGGEICLLEAGGFPVGIFTNNSWEECKVALAPGDRIILFTDGVSEARNPDGKMFTLQRFLDKLEEVKKHSLDDMLEAILNDVRSHAGPSFESDDVAVVMMEVKK